MSNWHHSFPKNLREMVKPPSSFDHQLVFGWTDGQVRSEHIQFCTRETIEEILDVLERHRGRAK